MYKLIPLIFFFFYFNIFIGQNNYLTITTNDKKIDIYKLSQYTIYVDSNSTANTDSEMYIFIFKKQKTRKYSNLKKVSTTKWSSFLDSCKNSKNMEFNLYNFRDKNIFSAMYTNGKLDILDNKIIPPLYLDEIK